MTKCTADRHFFIVPARGAKRWAKVACVCGKAFKTVKALRAIQNAK